MANCQRNDFALYIFTLDVSMIYTYECEQCGQFELSQSIHDDAISSCPTCSKPVERIITGGLMYIPPYTTLGMLADKNTSKNKAEISELEHGNTKKVDKTLARMTPAEQFRYIETGRKPIGLDKRT